MTVSGTGIVFCHMYERLSEIWAGLSKNFYGLTGNNVMVLIMLLALISIAFFAPFAALILNLNSLLLWITFFMMFFLRSALALAYRHDLYISVIFLHVTIIFGMIIAVNSFYKSRYGKVTWKDRNIKLQ